MWRIGMAIWVVVVGSQVIACGSDDDGNGGADIADQPLGGTVGGEPASVGDGGKTDYLLSDEETLFVSLFLGPYNGCGDLNTPDEMLLTSFPTTPGAYELGPDRGFTFYVNEENLVATDGVIVVDEVTDTTASIRVRATYDDDNQVEGSAEIDICPPP